jgi:hypothetical protein
MKSLIALLCVGSCLTLVASRSQATASICDAIVGNLVINCGFETGNFTAWTLSGNDVPGELNNLYGVEGTDPYPTPAGTAPHSGNYQAYFSDLVSNSTTLSQTVATVAGQQYTLSFYLAQQLLGPGTVNNSVTVAFNGTTVATLSNVGVQPYELFTYDVTATAASALFSLNMGNDTGEFLLDDVSVRPVPLPASAWLMLSGLVGLGALVCRRREESLNSYGKSIS